MPRSQVEEEGEAMDVLQPASTWELSRRGRLFAMQLAAECV